MQQTSLLSYQLIRGTGNTVLFMHGFLGDASQWQPIVEIVRKTHQFLVLELPGHGDNPSQNPYTIAKLADNIAAILIDLNIEHVQFVGHSMGGYVGCAFAKAYPEKVRSLTLINSSSSNDNAVRKSQRDRSLSLVEKYPDAFKKMAVANLFTQRENEKYQHKIEVMKTKSSSITNIAIENAIIAMRDRPKFDLSAIAHSLPITYILGSNDEIIPLQQVEEEIKKYGAHGKIFTAGHMLLITHTDEIMSHFPFNE
jgi:pimeloyl-ACP methyl ester carboxylesterase